MYFILIREVLSALEGWVDELHVKPKHAMKIGDVFIKCINESATPTYPNVYVVNKF